MKNYTLEYYQKNAEEFIDRTFSVDMSSRYEFFLRHLPNPKTILDLGFGSGRDSLYFQSRGIEVTSLDPVEEFCNRGKQLGLKHVICGTAQTMDFKDCFDGIWACASLLHLSDSELVQALNACKNALKDDGIMYASFKYGAYRGERNGRYFIDLNEQTVIPFLEQTGMRIVDILITGDARHDVDTKWLNLILRKQSVVDQNER